MAPAVFNLENSAKAGSVKICTKCGREGEFYKDSNKRDGLSCRCKECIKTDTKQYRKNNLKWIRERERKKRHTKYLSRKEAHNRESRAWAANHPDRVKVIKKRTHRKAQFALYGLTESKFMDMVAAQDNKCGICEKLFTSRVDTHIDHDHTTDSVRALLCPKCNRGLGHFNDNIELLLKAVTYLQRFANAA